MKIIKIGLAVFLVVLTIAGIFVYNNFNRLLSEALMKSFNSSIASDVYELKFEKLRLNIFERSIRVFNVSLLPRERPLREYPYINSSFRLTTEKLTLMKVQVFELLNSNRLLLERISITRPDIQLLLSGKKNILLPFKDSTVVSNQPKTNKKAIDSFMLDKFELIDASFHVTNTEKDREFKIGKFNISLNNLLIRQRPATDLVSFSGVELSLGEFVGDLQKGGVKHVGFKDFNIGIDSLNMKLTPDTLIFHFDDFHTGLTALDLQTRDSLFHLTLQSFKLSYREKSINIGEVKFMPNISDAAMQKRFVYQHTAASGKVGAISLRQVNFDSLIYYHGLFIDEILVDHADVTIFKDNTKPVDPQHLPGYFGQQIGAISRPLWIGKLKATNVNLLNTERKRDSSYAKVAIRRGKAEVSNITNLSRNRPLVLQAEAYVNDKVHFNIQLGFDYRQPQFTVVGKLDKFNLIDLNEVIQAYTPAKIHAGTADEISFSGTVYSTYSKGTMKFLYHDLKVDLELKEKAKWKSSVLAFAANTYLNSSNPGSNQPPRIVQYRVDRDMHKGFINIVIKSALMGVKETLIMSKQNKKDYREAKKEYKKQNK